MIRERWTDQKRARLRKLWDSEMSRVEIARAMGSSPGGVSTQAFKMGLAPRQHIKRGAAPYHKKPAPKPKATMPDPHVIESDWIKPITKKQLMARR